MTVLALTPTRLVFSHTDEQPADAATPTPARRPRPAPRRSGSARISSVAVTRVIPDPASYVPGVTMPSEVVLTIGWNVLSHIELEPAHCGDESCEADHGYTGTMTADDLTHAGQRGGGRRGRGAPGAGVRPGAVRGHQPRLMGADDRRPPASVADLPTSLPRCPGTARASLADLATSVLASLGGAGEPNPLDLPDAEPGLPAGRGRPGLGTAARSPGGRAVPVRAGHGRAPADGRLPGHHGDQPELAGHRPAARASTACSATRSRCPGRAGCSTRCAGTSAWTRWPGSRGRRSSSGRPQAGIGAFRVAPRRSGRPGCRSPTMRGADYRGGRHAGCAGRPRPRRRCKEHRPGAGHGLPR